jgi:superfamily II DNA/RNA helicase
MEAQSYVCLACCFQPPSPPALLPAQTLLFSATLPSWVKEITKRFLKPGFKTVDLVGSEKMKVRGRQPASQQLSWAGWGGQVHPG